MVTILFALALMSCWAATLPVAIDMNRFLNDKQQTKFEINYQVKYMNLSFQKASKGYFADLTVKLEILKADSVITQKEFTNKIGVTNLNDTESDQKSYLDKISLVLGGKSYKMRITFTDPRSTNSRVWTQDLIELSAERSISDIELSKKILPADTTRYMEKFRRFNWVYIVEPSHVFYPVLQDSMFVYCQVYGLTKDIVGNYPFVTEYNLLKDNIMIRTWQLKNTSKFATTSCQSGVYLKGLPYGLYDLEIVLRNGSKSEKTSTFFVLGEVKEDFISIFPKLDEEVSLLKYFVPNSKLSSIESLSNDAKKRMITKFWTSVASDNSVAIADWTTMIKDRISYANKFYSHFKPGWQTDRGRIHIRNGYPDDIIKGSTPEDAKFIQKEYQIWKYTKNDRVYIFIDIQMNGNYKLIYAKNDDKENSLADWQSYMGKDFDENDLEKDSSYPTR